MMTTIRRRAAVLGVAAALSVGLAACASEDPAVTEDETTTEDTTEDEMSEDEMSEDEMTEESALTLQPVGEACSAIDPEGEGSSEGMADDTVATAASNNPLLTTLVAAVVQAELVDTLNGLEAATVFAPYNPAFEAFTEEELNALLADTEQLTSVLTLHVVGENLTLEDLAAAGTVTTVQGGELTLDFEAGVEADLPTVASAGSTANVLCGNIQTANATVHLIDTVLLP